MSNALPSEMRPPSRMVTTLQYLTRSGVATALTFAVDPDGESYLTATNINGDQTFTKPTPRLDQPSPTWPVNDRVYMKETEDDVRISRAFLIAILRACGGHVTLDQYDMTADLRGVNIEVVHYQEPRRWAIELQEPE